MVDRIADVKRHGHFSYNLLFDINGDLTDLDPDFGDAFPVCFGLFPPADYFGGDL